MLKLMTDVKWRESKEEGSNSASGSVRACHAADSGLIPVVLWRGLWRFISRTSTLETVYVSWHAWPRKWRSRLTDIEWDINEPLRTGSFLAVSTLSVHIYLKYLIHIHAGRHVAVTMACDFGLKGLGYGSRLPRCSTVFSVKTPHLYVHSFDPGVNGYTWLDSDCLCDWIVTGVVMAVGLRAPQGVELVLKGTSPGKIDVKCIEIL